MTLWSLLAVAVYFVFFVAAWRWKPPARMNLVVITAMGATNLFLIDRGMPIGGRLIGALVGGAVAAITFYGWQLWQHERAKS